MKLTDITKYFTTKFISLDIMFLKIIFVSSIRFKCGSNLFVHYDKHMDNYDNHFFSAGVFFRKKI